MIVIKIDEQKLEEGITILSSFDNCISCPFYYTTDIDEGCITIGYCSLNRYLSFSETCVWNDDMVDRDGNVVDKIVRPSECPLISIEEEPT